MKIDNPIVKEVREARRQILASYDWDYRSMMRDMMQRQWESGHKVVAAAKTSSRQSVAVSNLSA
jgi:hypothetical protein